MYVWKVRAVLCIHFFVKSLTPFFHLFVCFSLIGKRHAYSNLGYTILGQVIERATGQAYEEFMVSILKSVEVSQMKIGRTRKKDLDANEVSIYIRPNLRFLIFFFSRLYYQWTLYKNVSLMFCLFWNVHKTFAIFWYIIWTIGRKEWHLCTGDWHAGCKACYRA